MTHAKPFIRSALGALLLLSALGHVLMPGLTSGLIPAWLPPTPVHVFTAALEVALGIGVFVPAYRSRALLGVAVLLLAFLPLHIADYFRPLPAIGPKAVAAVRIPLQFLLIYLAWACRR